MDALYRRMRYIKCGKEPCRTGGLVPGIREIKRLVLDRLLYYLV